MTREEFIAKLPFEELERKFRGPLLLLQHEAWVTRKEPPSALGMLADEHYIRVRQNLRQIYEAVLATFPPTIPAKQPIDPIKPPPAAPQQQRKP